MVWTDSTVIIIQLFAVSTFLHLGGSRNTPKTDSYRLAIFTIMVPSIFLTLAYSGTIISFITVRKINTPFNSLEEMIEDGTFKIGYTKNSFPKSWFQVRKKSFHLKN